VCSASGKVSGGHAFLHFGNLSLKRTNRTAKVKTELEHCKADSVSPMCTWLNRSSPPLRRFLEPKLSCDVAVISARATHSLTVRWIWTLLNHCNWSSVARTIKTRATRVKEEVWSPRAIHFRIPSKIPDLWSAKNFTLRALWWQYERRRGLKRWDFWETLTTQCKIAICGQKRVYPFERQT
jgi:hypothetical protein